VIFSLKGIMRGKNLFLLDTLFKQYMFDIISNKKMNAFLAIN